MLNWLIGVLEIESGVFTNLVGEFSVFINGKDWIVWSDNLLLTAQLVIVVTESRSAMDNSSTGVCRNEVSSKHSEASVSSSFLEEVEQWFVFGAFQIQTLDLLDHFIGLWVLIEILHSTLRHDIDIVSLDILELEIDEIRIDS